MTKLRAPPLAAALCLVCVFCNRTVGGGLAHIAVPHPDGSPCNNDVQCRSDHCDTSAGTQGTCMPPPNGTVEIDSACSGGAPCVADAACEDGICVETAAACAPLLAICASSDDCCSGACEISESPAVSCDPCCSGSCIGSDLCVGCLPIGTCTAGAGMCAAEGDVCVEDSDCCAGNCDFRSNPGSSTGSCSTACKALGDGCTGGDCCDGYCSFDNGQCLSCSIFTNGVGNQCVSNADCCGETCMGGLCQCVTGDNCP